MGLINLDKPKPELNHITISLSLYQRVKVINTVNNLFSAHKALSYYKDKAINKHVSFLSKHKCQISKKIFADEAGEIIFKSFFVSVKHFNISKQIMCIRNSLCIFEMSKTRHYRIYIFFCP